MTAQELADALEVSVRTVYRDMESLAAAGVPLYGEAGHDGGYRLVDGYRTRLTGLTAGEADSLFLTGLPSAAADLGLGASVTAAQLKLMAALPADLRDRAGRVAGRFHLDAPRGTATPTAHRISRPSRTRCGTSGPSASSTCAGQNPKRSPVWSSPMDWS
jgi:predicted DNA-binding transcriptional regulator YafY